MIYFSFIFHFNILVFIINIFQAKINDKVALEFEFFDLEHENFNAISELLPNGT